MTARSLRRTFGAGVLFLFAACASDQRTVEFATQQQGGGFTRPGLLGAQRRSSSLGTVAGRRVTAEDLLVELHTVMGRDLLAIVDRLVSDRLAQAEADRMSLSMDPELFDREYARVREAMLAEFERAFPGQDHRAVIEREMGVDASAHAARLREATQRELVTERVVRATTLGYENAKLQLIVVAEEAQANELHARLTAGEDFATLAREASLDDTRERGGLVPYLVRDDATPLSRATFLLKPGELSKPFQLGRGWVLLKLLEKRAPIQGKWPTVKDRVEASLLEHPVVEAEFLFWQLLAESRYLVELSPLSDLLGLAVPKARTAPVEAGNPSED